MVNYFNTTIDCNQLTNATKFETINYITTRKFIFVPLTIVFGLGVLLFFIFGMKSTGKNKILLQFGNYWLFFIILLIMVLGLIFSLFFPFHLMWFD